MSSVTPRMVKRFYATRTIDHSFDDKTTSQRKGFANEPSAWLWVARASLFRARDARCFCQKLLDEYKGSPAWDGGPEQCRYCDPSKWRPIVSRLARIMRNRAKSASLSIDAK